MISGCINMTGVLKIRTTKEFGESTVSKILELVENSSSRKSKSENFISKFAKYYTPAVCYGALALALFRPIVAVDHGNDTGYVGRLDLQSPYFPGNQLSMCPGDQYSAKLFCRNRRRQQSGSSGKRLQLSGDSVPDKICGI